MGIAILILLFIALLCRLLAKDAIYRRARKVLRELRTTYFIVEKKVSPTTALIRVFGDSEESQQRVSTFEPEGILDSLELDVLYSMSVYRDQPLWIAPLVSGGTYPTVEDDVRRVLAENRDIP